MGKFFDTHWTAKNRKREKNDNQKEKCCKTLKAIHKHLLASCHQQLHFQARKTLPYSCCKSSVQSWALTLSEWRGLQWKQSVTTIAVQNPGFYCDFEVPDLHRNQIKSVDISAQTQLRQSSLLLAECHSRSNIKTFLFAQWRQPKQELVCKKKWQKILVGYFSIYIRKNLTLFQHKRTLTGSGWQRFLFSLFVPTKTSTFKIIAKVFLTFSAIQFNAPH